MSKTLMIAARDFKSIVFSPMFFLLSGLFTCLWSYNFPRQLIAFAMGSARKDLNIHFTLFVQHFSSILFVLMVVTPVLTMRLLAEEKRQGTYDLMLTAPVTATEIAIGKFIAGVLSVSIFLLIAFIYPLLTVGLAKFYLGPMLTSFFGLFFMASLFVGVGLFCSSLTSSALISVVMGFVFNFMLWVVGQSQGMSDNPFFVDLAQQFSASYHYSSFLYGKITISSIVFFVSSSAFLVFLTQRVIESSRWRS